MKRIYILRHSKAGQTNKRILDDHERPLTDKGIEQCPRVATHLTKHNATIDLVMSSPSVRTKTTTELVLKHLGTNPPINYIPKLYLGSAEDILAEVRQADDHANAILLVGHNPGLHMFLNQLVGSGEGTLVKMLAGQYYPGTIAAVEIDKESWHELRWRSGELIDYFASKKTSQLEAA